jgi:DNA-binding PadR family transcriptional regulator
MLYDLLATLWDGPSTGADVARAMEARTGQRFSPEAAERYLRLLNGCGFAGTSANPLAPLYNITPDGSQLLARLARDVESLESISA